MTINAPVEIFVIKTHSVLNYCHFRRATLATDPNASFSPRCQKISRAWVARIGPILNC